MSTECVYPGGELVGALLGCAGDGALGEEARAEEVDGHGRGRVRRHREPTSSPARSGCASGSSRHDRGHALTTLGPSRHQRSTQPYGSASLLSIFSIVVTSNLLMKLTTIIYIRIVGRLKATHSISQSLLGDNTPCNLPTHMNWELESNQIDKHTHELKF